MSKSLYISGTTFLLVLCIITANAVESWKPLSHRLRVATPAVRRMASVGESARGAAEDGRWWLPVSQLRGLRSLYEECIAGESTDQGIACLKGKALVLLGRSMHFGNVTIADGVTLVSSEDATMTRTNRMITSEKQLEETLPRELGQREQRLDEMLMEHVTSFLQTHTVRIDLSGRDLQETFSEARKKSKKGLPYILFALFALKKMALAYSLKMIALIAAKALLVAKIALVISAVIGLKKILSHDGDHHHSEVVAHTRTEPYHGGGGGYGRSIKDTEEAHKLAYSNQIPRST